MHADNKSRIMTVQVDKHFNSAEGMLSSAASTRMRVTTEASLVTGFHFLYRVFIYFFIPRRLFSFVLTFKTDTNTLHSILACLYWVEMYFYVLAGLCAVFFENCKSHNAARCDWVNRACALSNPSLDLRLHWNDGERECPLPNPTQSNMFWAVNDIITYSEI